MEILKPANHRKQSTQKEGGGGRGQDGKTRVLTNKETSKEGVC